MSTFPKHFRVQYHLYFRSDSLGETCHVNSHLMCGHFSDEHLEWYVKEITPGFIEELNESRSANDFRPMTENEIQELLSPFQADYGEVVDGKHPRFRH